jgi:hypothetical protein
MRIGKLISLILILFVCQSTIGQIKKEIAKTIVRVRSGNKYSTGFFWKDGRTILTTLHSLSSFNDIEVYIPEINNWKKATANKVFKSNDLISLLVSGYTSSNYISQRYNSAPAIDTRVFAIGYNSGNASYIDRDFQVGLLQGNTLNDLLPPSSKQEIRSLGFPSLSTQIIYLKGNLLHGFSGAPVVDMQGLLVGIADGGLENGAAAISWCITSAHISTLENSNESLPHLNQSRINILFAAEEYENKEGNENVIEIEGHRFRKMKTRSFSQLDITGKYSSMDALGLTQLLNNFSIYNYSSFRYDIYLDETSGSTIVLPEGNELSSENGLITSGTEKIKFYISIVRTYNIQQSSLSFEAAIMPNYYTFWAADPIWSYAFPYPGPNNSFVRRRAYYGNNGRYYLFEALAGNDKYFLGVAAKRDNVLMSPYDIEEWAKSAIAIQLTTFTN